MPTVLSRNLSDEILRKKCYKTTRETPQMSMLTNYILHVIQMKIDNLTHEYGRSTEKSMQSPVFFIFQDSISSFQKKYGGQTSCDKFPLDLFIRLPREIILLHVLDVVLNENENTNRNQSELLF